MVLVTHDRALIDAVATRTWAVEDGAIREVLGGYTDLLRARDRERREREREAQRAAEAQRGARPGRPAGVPAPPASREMRRLEEEIATIEAELKVTRARLLDPDTFADLQTGAQAGRDHDRLSGALADLYERWESLAGSA
jgi:ATPase subunit of ABC transporter with duplicated ATPase domains